MFPVRFNADQNRNLDLRMAIRTQQTQLLFRLVFNILWLVQNHHQSWLTIREAMPWALSHKFLNHKKSFDFESLKNFRQHSDLPLVFLFGTVLGVASQCQRLNSQNSCDGLTLHPSTGENSNWNDPDYDWSDYPKWKNISELCYGIGPSKRLIVTNKYVENFEK